MKLCAFCGRHEEQAFDGSTLGSVLVCPNVPPGSFAWILPDRKSLGLNPADPEPGDDN